MVFHFKKFTLTRLEPQPLTTLIQDYNQYTMRVIYSILSRDIR